MSDRGDLQDYIDTCRARIESQVAAFHEFSAAVSRSDSDSGRGLEPMLESLEYDHFNNLLIVLDAYFADREETAARAAGPVAREVRNLRNSLIHGEGELLSEADEPDDADRRTSVLGLAPGDAIQLTEQTFGRLAGAYFAELERRWVR